jgi:hypothetical protein
MACEQVGLLPGSRSFSLSLSLSLSLCLFLSLRSLSFRLEGLLKDDKMIDVFAELYPDARDR